MNKICRQYYVGGNLMNPEFRLSPLGMARLVQDCFCFFVAPFGLAAFDLRKRGLMWIISDITMDLSGERPFWGEPVEVELWLSESPKVKVVVETLITYKGRTIMKGSCTWALLDTATRKPADAGSILRDVPVNAGQSLGLRRFVFPPSGEKAWDFSYPTLFSDTDFNYHVSNLSYIRLCTDAMPCDYLRSHALRFFSIRFLNESFLGDTLVCSVSHAEPRTGQDESMDGWISSVESEPGKTNVRVYSLYGPLVPQSELADGDMELRRYFGK